MLNGFLAKAEASFRAGDLDSARITCLTVLKANPGNSDALHLLGALAFSEKRYDESEAFFLRSIAIGPSNASYHNSLGNVLRARGEFDAAAAAYRRGLHLDPSLYPAYRGLAICLRASGDLSGSAAELGRLLRVRPSDVEAHCELGITRRMQQQLDTALKCFRIALRLSPNHRRAQRGLAETLLLAGDFRRGWPEYQRGLSTVRLPVPDPKNPAFRGKRVLVYGSEGVGDEIMAVRCIPQLAAIASDCTVYTDQRLQPLFQRSFATVRCLGMTKVEGYQVPVGATGPQEISLLTSMLLPYFAGDSAISGPTAYLAPDGNALDKWRHRYAGLGSGLKLGLSWRGGGIAESRVHRSIPLALWKTLLNVSGVHFISLQHGDVAAEIRSAGESSGTIIHHWSDSNPLVDLDDFAAQIAALDLVISVDNSTAHMAGAVGVRVWTLLGFSPDWRWGLGRENTSWYPSMRLFRQERLSNWSSLLDTVRSHLISLLGVRPSADAAEV